MQSELFEKVSAKFSKYEKIIFAVVLVGLITITAYLRVIPAQSYYFNDPDTFYHYERYKMLLNGDIGKFYDKIYPPTGGVPSTNVELYAWWVVLTAPLRIFMDSLTAFKYGQVVMYIFTAFAIFFVSYLLTRRKWLSLTSVIAFGFTIAGWMRTYGGNARGDNVFIGLMLYTLALFILIMRETNEKKLKVYSVISSLLAFTASVVWAGSKFNGVFFGILFGFIIFQKILNEDYNYVAKIRKYILIPWTIFIGIMAIVYKFEYTSYMLNYGSLKLMAYSMVGVTILSYILEFVKKKFSDYRVTLGVGFGSAIVGVLVFLYKFSYAFNYSIRTYNPIALTIQELSGVSVNSIMMYYTMFANKLSNSGDGIFYVFSMVIGTIILAYKILERDKYRNIMLLIISSIVFASLKKPYISIHGIFISLVGIASLLLMFYVLVRRINNDISEDVALVILSTFGIFMWWASRFLFFGIVSISILLPYIMRIISDAIISSNVTFRKIAIGLTLLIFVSSAYVNGATMKDYSMQIRGIYYNGKYYGSVPIEYESALEYIHNNSNNNDVVVTWWDYGYWIESSLLSNRPALIDGSHNRIFDHVVAKWFSSDPTYEFNWDMFNVKWFIAWYADIAKMNAINYLGGTISKDEYMHTVPIIILSKTNVQGQTVYVGQGVYAQVSDDNNTVIVIGANKYLAKRTIIVGKGVYTVKSPSLPVIDYDAYVYDKYMIVIRDNIVNSIWYKLATLQYFGDPNIEPKFATIGSTQIVVYKFRPFALYGVSVNGNITQLDKLNWTIPTNSTLLIKVYGRDGKGDLIVEHSNGDEEIIAKGIYLTNETKPFNNVTITKTVTDVKNIYFRTWGWYGRITSLASVNGKKVSPFNIAGAIKDGTNTVSINVMFDKSGVPIRAGIIVYAIIVRDENNYVKTYFRVLDEYFPVNTTSREGTTTISFSFTSNNIKKPEYYYEKLYNEYGKENVNINVFYMIYIEGYKKYDILPDYYKQQRK